MPLISNGEIVADPWTPLADDAPLPEAGDVILGLARLQRDAAAIARRSGRTGVALANTETPRALLPYLDDLDLIALAFPAFTDGRAYSQARLLRAGLGFKGELRATGQVLADQAAFMQRCGFDSFEPDKPLHPEDMARAFATWPEVYQPAVDARTPIWSLRHANNG